MFKLTNKPYEGPLMKRSCYKMKTPPLQFKGADHTNSKCWPGCKKVGTKISGRTGRRVNDCDCGDKYSKK